MSKQCRPLEERGYCSAVVNHIIGTLQRQGLTLREIEDALHFGPFAFGGSGSGGSISRRKSDTRVPFIRDTARWLRTFVDVPALAVQQPESSIELLVQSALQQIKADANSARATTPRHDVLQQDQARFDAWNKSRLQNQQDERDRLKERTMAVNRAVASLRIFLASINASGHDSWGCAIPPYATENSTWPFGSEPGSSPRVRDGLLQLMDAAIALAKVICLEVAPASFSSMADAMLSEGIGASAAGSRTRNQTSERKKLMRRVAALKKALERLRVVLDSINGSGHDGWECNPQHPRARAPYWAELPTTGEILRGNDCLLAVLDAVVARAANTTLEIDWCVGSFINPHWAGTFMPKPAALTSEEVEDMHGGRYLCPGPLPIEGGASGHQMLMARFSQRPAST